ncbi:MAG: PHP domain-containing protein [Pyramidobacter sp.]|nr:PHP domain-containing protein [Pyramidobacter sp.]
MIRIDMHFHSSCSDGSESPEAMARLGRRRGLTLMSLTDHDTVEGVIPFLAASRRLGVRAISGIEISADYPQTMHILGYNFDPKDEEFHRALKKIQNGREERNRKMLERLQELGISITMEDVQKEAGKGIVGRPHFAFALIRKGVVRDIMSAFSEYLGRGARAYVHKVSLTPEETIRAIHQAGGVSVLAHPVQTAQDPAVLTDILRQLKSFGLWGLECYSGHHNYEQTKEYRAMAAAFGLEATAGSDYHGRGRPGYHFGVPVPETLLPWARLGIRM